MANNEDKLIETLADAFSGCIVRHTPEEREEVSQSEVEYCWEVFGEYGLHKLLLHREYDLAKFREMKEKCQNAQEIRDIRIILPDYLANFYKYYEVTSDQGGAAFDWGARTYGHEIRFSVSDKHDFVLAYLADDMCEFENIDRIFKDAEDAYLVVKRIEKYLPADVRLECYDEDDFGTMLTPEWRYDKNNKQENFTRLYFPKEDENLIARVCRIVMPSDVDMAFMVHYNKIMRVAHDLKWIFNRGRHYNPSAVGLVPVRTN
jgi:hypothetical protein